MKSILGLWQIWAALAALFASLTALLAKIGVKDINSNYATFIRTCVVITFLAAIVFFRGDFQSPASIPRKSLLFLILSGFATGASWLCYFYAIKIGPVSQVAAIDKMSLMLVAVLGVLVLGEKLSLYGWLGVALMAAGTLLIGLGK